MVLSWVDGILEVGPLGRSWVGGDPSSDFFSARIGGKEDITQPPHPPSLQQILPAGLALCRCGEEGVAPCLTPHFLLFLHLFLLSPNRSVSLLPSSQDFSHFLPPHFSSISVLLPPVTAEMTSVRPGGLRPGSASDPPSSFQPSWP